MTQHSQTPPAAFARPRNIRPAHELDDLVRGIAPVVPRWRGEEGARPYIAFGLGGVQLGRTDPGKIARSTELRLQRALSDNGVMTIELDVPVKGASKGLARRGAVVGMTSKSRSRMVRTLCCIDFSKIAGDGCTPGMVTLTLPHDWTAVCPRPEDFKRAVNTFRGRYERAWGKPMPGVWKIEFQERQQCISRGCHDPRAPHMHILTDVPQGTALRPISLAERRHLAGCKRDVCAHDAHFREDMLFPEWLSHAWALSVGAEGDEFLRHLAAGTNVSYEETLRYADVKRIAVYFTKHGTFQNKAYQDNYPETWRAAVHDQGEKDANLWGRWVVPVVRSIFEVDESLIMHISRVLRGWQRSTGYVRTTEVWRLNTRTGNYRKRRVRRRVKYMRGNTGFLSVNDGVAMAGIVARLIDLYSPDRDWFDEPPIARPGDGTMAGWGRSMSDLIHADARPWQAHQQPFEPSPSERSTAT